MNNAFGFGFQQAPRTVSNVDAYFGGVSLGAPSSFTGMSANPFGASDFLNTNMSDPGQQTNEVLPRHVQMCPNMNPHENSESVNAIRTIGVGMLLFGRKHFAVLSKPPEDDALTKFQQSSFVTQDGTSTQFFEWTQLVRWLANHSNRYATAEDVLHEWKFAGGLKNEVTPNTQSTYGRRPHSRLVNTTVRGPFSTFNIWAERLAPCQSLYFIAIKGPVDSCFPHVMQKKNGTQEYGMAGFDFHKYWESDSDRSSKRMRLSDDAKSAADRKVKEVQNYVWKIIPWTHKQKTKPDLADLTYEDIAYDMDGKMYVTNFVGAFVKVGHVHYSEGRPDLRPEQRGNTKHPDAHLANTIALFNRGLLSNVEIIIGI